MNLPAIFLESPLVLEKKYVQWMKLFLLSSCFETFLLGRTEASVLAVLKLATLTPS